MNRQLTAIWHAVRRFLTEDLWDRELSALPWFRRRLVRLTRIGQLVTHGFREDDCPLHASALTYYTLMALVPILALALALSRVFGGETLAREHVRGVVRSVAERMQVESAVDESMAPAADFDHDAHKLTAAFAREIEERVEDLFDQIMRIDLATLGGIGLVLLIWMVLGMLGRVEASFNRVWAVKSQRTLWRKFTDYLSVLLILPLLATAASSIPIATTIAQHVPRADGLMTSLLNTVLLRRMATLAATTGVFTFILVFMPNTRVRLGPGLAGGLVTALLFTGWLKICTALQVGVVRYSRIYGGFATVPILLAWVYVSWQIILLGSEVAFAVQNSDTYRMDQGARSASQRARLLLALAVASACARAMHGAKRFYSAEFSARHGVSPRLLNDVLADLESAGVVAETAGSEGIYVFCRDPAKTSRADVIKMMLSIGTAPLDVGLKDLGKYLADADRAIDRALDAELNQPVDATDG